MEYWRAMGHCAVNTAFAVGWAAWSAHLFMGSRPRLGSAVAVLALLSAVTAAIWEAMAFPT